jgi:hypothetical protein
MKPTPLYRIAAVIFILFAVGHTIGFLSFKRPTAEGLAVRDAMNQVHFQVKGSDFSYGGFYVGFGLFVTVYLLFSAFLAWHLGSLASKHSESIGTLGWTFFAVQMASMALSLTYFSVVPAVLSGLVAACLGWGAWLVQSANRRSVDNPARPALAPAGAVHE